MEYTLRNLVADDLFTMMTIIGKIGLKEFSTVMESDDIKQLISSYKDKESKKADVEYIGLSVGLKIGSVICINMEKCKDDIYRLLSGLSGIPAMELANVPAKTFTGMIFDVVKKDEFFDFFQQALTFVS